MKIAIVGEYDSESVTHLATETAIRHCGKRFNADFRHEWLSTVDVADTDLSEFSGFWVAPGSPYKRIEGAIHAIRFARENDVPCLGTCGGFQHMIIEYARNALGFSDAQHAEYDPYASSLFVSSLVCSLVGKKMDIKFDPKSRVSQAYGRNTAQEEYYCNFGLNPKFRSLFQQADFRIVGADTEGDVRAMEISSHPFFVGTLFVPQARSLPGAPHPLVTAFCETCKRRK